MKFKLTKAAQEAIDNEEPLSLGSSDGFWYDLTQGGYFKPKDIIVDKVQLAAIKVATELLMELEELYDSVREEF